MKNSQNLFNRFNNLFFSLLIFLIPLFFLPITAGFYEFNKNILLYFGVILLLLLWGVKILMQKQFTLKTTPLDLPILALVIAFILATIFVSPNKMEAFWLPRGTGTIIALGLMYFLAVNNLTSLTTVIAPLLASGSILGLIAAWQFFGLSQTYVPIAWMKDKLWTPAEEPLALVTFLLIAFILSLVSFLKMLFREKKSAKSIFGYAIASIFIFLGLVVTGFQIMPGKPAQITTLPYSQAWAIAIEAFKQRPLFGVGPENFLSAFNRFRLISFNNYSFWNFRFASSANYPLQVLTTAGGLGFIAVVWLALVILRRLKLNSALTLAILANLILLLILPANLLSLFTLFLLLALWVPDKKTRVIALKNLSWLPLVISSVFSVICLYLGGRAYMAEVFFQKSLEAFAKNEAIPVYNLQIKAINLNPQRTLFHLAYSQTNLALANGLATKNTPDNKLTDQDRNNITQLVQQSLREARAATALNPLDANNWENLTQIYQSLINFAQDADQWALATAQQTVSTDPINPRLRLTLGGLYYMFGNYEQAAVIFSDVVNLKVDYANGYYNLASALKQQKKYQQAYQAMQLTLNYLPASSPDWEKAKKELDELGKLLPSPTPSPSLGASPTPPAEEQLTKPETKPSPVIQPPIELPTETPAETPQPIPSPEL